MTTDGTDGTDNGICRGNNNELEPDGRTIKIEGDISPRNNGGNNLQNMRLKNYEDNLLKRLEELPHPALQPTVNSTVNKLNSVKKKGGLSVCMAFATLLMIWFVLRRQSSS